MQHCTTETPWERRRRLRNNKQIRKTNAEHYSQRCDFLNRMRVELLPHPSLCLLGNSPACDSILAGSMLKHYRLVPLASLNQVPIRL